MLWWVGRDGYAFVRMQDQIVSRDAPWVNQDLTPESLALFESEVGLSTNEIVAIAYGTGPLVVAISADRDKVVRQVAEFSPWADVATVEQVGDFDLITFGTTLNFDRRSTIRPIGQPGELAVTDGLLLWSSEIGVVKEAIQSQPPGGLADIADAVERTDDEWTELETLPARSVADALNVFAVDDPGYQRLYDSYTQFGNPVEFDSTTILQNQHSDGFTVLVKHDSAEEAKINGVRIPGVLSREVDLSTGRQLLGDDFDLAEVTVKGEFVILRMIEKREGQADIIWLSRALTWERENA